MFCMHVPSCFSLFQNTTPFTIRQTKIACPLRQKNTSEIELAESRGLFRTIYEASKAQIQGFIVLLASLTGPRLMALQSFLSYLDPALSLPSSPIKRRTSGRFWARIRFFGTQTSSLLHIDVRNIHVHQKFSTGSKYWCLDRSTRTIPWTRLEHNNDARVLNQVF